MLNFRKLKQDFSSNVLKQGKDLHDKKNIISAKILNFSKDALKVKAKVLGNFDTTYESEIEIDRFESSAIHSNCDCSYKYDCQHIAALVYYLEEHINSLIIDFSNDNEKEVEKDIVQTIDDVIFKEQAKKDKNYKKEVLEEYEKASDILSSSFFFQKIKEKNFIRSELALILNSKSLASKNIEFQIVLKIPSRSKPMQILDIKSFFNAILYEEEIVISGKSWFFSLDSFLNGKEIIKILMQHTKCGYQEKKIGSISCESFGFLLFRIFEKMNEKRGFLSSEEELPFMPFIFLDGLENPLQCSFSLTKFYFELEHIEPPASKLLINPKIKIDNDIVRIDDVLFLPSVNPGMIYKNVYYKFFENIKRVHIKNLEKLREMIIPEALFGTFVENSLFEIKHYGDIGNESIIDKFVTIPYTKEVKGRCKLSFVDKELEASLYFIYDDLEVHSICNNLSYEEVMRFVSKNGILARNILEERKIVDELFQGFLFNKEHGSYVAKSEKKIVEFMTETLPRYKDKIKFECPQNLLDLFVYDKTEIFLDLDYKGKVGYYNIDLKVKGDLKGVSLDKLWECMVSKRCFIDVGNKKDKFSKILVLDLDVISKLVQIFDELGIKKLQNGNIERPLWSLVSVNDKIFEGLPVKFSMSDSLLEMQKQILGEKEFIPTKIPSFIKDILRPYQKEGIYWIERLRSMYLNGILADDMGLGKTLQAIIAISKQKKKSIVVCPTSLLHNWKEEFYKFNKKVKVKVVDGTPLQRKKIIDNIDNFDVVITSYTLMQKDIEQYEKLFFGYAILDEAQHIKNRSTRNAKSVKRVRAAHKLILTGTPIENSLEELWSLFDFLMPGFLSSYERFLEKYVRSDDKDKMKYLKKKVSPFILRRMKTDVLKDLPPISEIVYHCKLSKVQEDLYKSYARSAKEELSKLVEKEGFKKVQIHVLATLTRLKQICCHPAIFAKEKAEESDSSKYDMLLELLKSLVEGNHKTVVFSQYAKMLQIMKEDFIKRGIKFSYLDGSTKNRLEIVKEFNENKDISVFLVSLKAGGIGLNITGADTIIHYDMWWNPAVENQATDRVYRIGQEKSVSCYKLITSNSIEEKIVELQNRKKGLVKKVISCDDEVINKLTWEDVLELLQI